MNPSAQPDLPQAPVYSQASFDKAAEVWGKKPEAPEAPPIEAKASEPPAVVETPTEKNLDTTSTTPIEKVEDKVAEDKIEEEPSYKLSDLKTRFGDDFADIDTFTESVKTTKGRAQKLDEIENDYNELTLLKGYVDSPFANENIEQIDAFVRATGIKDISLAAKFTGKNSADLVKNAVEFLAFSSVVETPGLLDTMSFSKICEAIADKYETTVDVKAEDVPPAMEMAVGMAAAALKPKLDAAATKKDSPLASLKANRDNYTKAVNDTINVWQPKLNEFTPSLVEVEIAGDEKNDIAPLKISVPVRAEFKEGVQKEVLNIIRNNPGIEPTAENITHLKSFVRSRMMELHHEDALKAVYHKAILDVRGEAKKDAAKEFANGKSIIREDKPGPAKQKEPNSIEKWLKS